MLWGVAGDEGAAGAEDANVMTADVGSSKPGVGANTNATHTNLINLRHIILPDRELTIAILRTSASISHYTYTAHIHSTR